MNHSEVLERARQIADKLDYWLQDVAGLSAYSWVCVCEYGTVIELSVGECGLWTSEADSQEELTLEECKRKFIDHAENIARMARLIPMPAARPAACDTEASSKWIWDELLPILREEGLNRRGITDKLGDIANELACLHQENARLTAAARPDAKEENGLIVDEVIRELASVAREHPATSRIMAYATACLRSTAPATATVREAAEYRGFVNGIRSAALSSTMNGGNGHVSAGVLLRLLSLLDENLAYVAKTSAALTPPAAVAEPTPQSLPLCYCGHSKEAHSGRLSAMCGFVPDLCTVKGDGVTSLDCLCQEYNCLCQEYKPRAAAVRAALSPAAEEK